MYLPRILFTLALLTAAYSAAATGPFRAYGRVECGGKGVAGVPVTDGNIFTVTDHKGRYRLDTSAEFVYITLPDGYAIPMEGNLPCIYRRTDAMDGKKRRFDFTLEKNTADYSRHTFVAVADPQVYFDKDVAILHDAAADLRELREASAEPLFGVVLGDIIGHVETDRHLFDSVNNVLASSGVPFFYALGNHDMDIGVRTTDHSKETFKGIYGPTYYSFNRGNVHYVVLDDVFFLARSYLYAGYLEERQMKWLERDLAFVPHGSTVVVCLHIPTYSREARARNWGAESYMKVMNNRRGFYEILEPYNVHIMSAHEHYNENYTLADNLYEHVHAAVSGLFWESYWNSDGTPSGYGVYRFDGPGVRWHYKAVGYPADLQFHAYPPGRNVERPEAVTANVWNWDEKWQVRWTEDGEDRGPMEKYTGTDMTIYYDVVANGDNFTHKGVGAGHTEHLFFAVPAREGSAITVEVTDRFGNVYTQKVR
ncbi:MAG: calcineurin-like phosphoesterase family protein [Alistipes sp.]|nr:calcineurin-like phosphoesterase family protein [Alistipes sp.]